ncbi:MAG: hypothetical protein Q7U53_06585 [Anaerolineaceae bacterium]|nr:hypothetical protein [Anaerolineaceae bacterium]
MKTNFDPKFHGYSFINRFEFKGFSKIFKTLSNKLIYGMCGGMVFSALDFYFDQKIIPDYSKVDQIPENYAKYLWKRQSESTSISVLIKIIKFASLSKKSSINMSIKDELPQIIDRLIDKLPVPIVIIRSSLFQNPTHNHQVLVTGIEEHENCMKLKLYDPNHPKSEPFLIIQQYPELLIQQSTGELVRGFFVNTYSYKFSYLVNY